MVNKTYIEKILNNILFKHKIENTKCLTYDIQYSYTNSKGEPVTLELHEYKLNNKNAQKAFRDKLLEAYNYQLVDGWRVDVYETDENGDYHPLPLSNWDNTRTFVTKSGSTIAIREDGDIISVCKNLAEIPSDNMKALLKFATDNGGTKLDSFDGNWGFYRACGFEPVSWIYFNEEYAPKGENGWIKGVNASEPIIFMKHTNDAPRKDRLDVYKEKTEFYKNVVPNTGDNAYDDAYDLRDKEL